MLAPDDSKAACGSLTGLRLPTSAKLQKRATVFVAGRKDGPLELAEKLVDAVIISSTR